MAGEISYKRLDGTTVNSLEEALLPGFIGGSVNMDVAIGNGPYNGNLPGISGSGSGNGIGYGSGTDSGSGGSKASTAPAQSGISHLDIAQSHHFVIELGGFTHYRTPAGSFTKFLPVKSISLNHTSYENMSIPLSVLGDLPLLNRKRLTSLSLTCFDMDNNKLEGELMTWENQCFPKNKFVAYLDDVARELIYRGYNVKGKQTLERRMYVIPSGGVSVSRDYSANDAKLISFNLIAVGDGISSAQGKAGGVNGKQVDVPVIDHGGGGTGGGGFFAEAYDTGIWDSETGRPLMS